MTESEKIDFLYSKFVSPNRSQTSVFNRQIWTQGDQIPTFLPEFDSNNEYVNPSGEIILKKYDYVRMFPMQEYPNAFSSSDVIDIVSFQNGFDASYQYKFYTKASNESYIPIPFAESDYFFDHDTGVLFFPKERTRLYNPSSLYVSFIKYVGERGINIDSQFPGNPQHGPVGPTGPIGETGETGPTNEFSIRYRGAWSSSAAYSKWNVVKYNSKFFISTSDLNVYTPINGKYWQPFGLPQLSTSFNCPDDTYWVSPSFTIGSGRFNNIESVFVDINSNSLTDVTVILYPGDYQINNDIVVRPDVNLNIVSYGRVNISFANESLSLIFLGNNRVEFRGHDLHFTNGNIRLVCSNLSIVGGSLPNVALVTTNMSDTSRLMCVDSKIDNLLCYGSFCSLRGTNVVGGITLDEVSVVHLESCMIQARPIDDVDQHKIDLVSSVASGTPPGFGYEHPALLIKNCRILSNGAVLRSTIDPLYGFVFCAMSSSLYVADSSTSFLDLSDQIDAIIFDTVVNTTYDDTKLQILNVNGEFQTVDANFED